MKARAFAPEDPNPALNHGLTLLRLNRDDEAQRVLAEAAAQFRDSEAIRNALQLAAELNQKGMQKGPCP